MKNVKAMVCERKSLKDSRNSPFSLVHEFKGGVELFEGNGLSDERVDVELAL